MEVSWSPPMAKNPRSFRLSDPTVVDLQWLAERLGVSHTAAIVRAGVVYCFYRYSTVL
jgi:hypothetical protein